MLVRCATLLWFSKFVPVSHMEGKFQVGTDDGKGSGLLRSEETSLSCLARPFRLRTFNGKPQFDSVNDNMFNSRLVPEGSFGAAVGHAEWKADGKARTAKYYL